MGAAKVRRTALVKSDGTAVTGNRLARGRHEPAYLVLVDGLRVVAGGRRTA